MEGIVIEDHRLKEQGVVTLQRLLIVIECVRPEIRYVPILYPLCAMFLHYMSAEETFACVMRLLSQGNTFILQSELAVFASCHTLLSLLKKHKRSVYSMLKRRAGTADELKLAEIFSPWTSWIFKHMPFEYLARVMDCFLVEGHKMLLRIILSLVYIWYKERSRLTGAEAAAAAASSPNKILRAQTMPTRPNNLSIRAGKKAPADGEDSASIDARIGEITSEIAAVAQMPNFPISVQTLLDMGCSIRNFKHSTFEHRQKHYEDKFREQVARRRADQVQLRTKHTIYTAAFESKIIDSEAASELMCALPSRFQLETPQLLFRLSESGASFVQLWSMIDDAEQSLLIIRSTNNEIFGAYCSSCWIERRDLRERTKTRYFGTGESFVWHLHPELKLPVIHYWAGKNIENPDGSLQMIMTAGDRYLVIGSGGGDAIAIRDELTRGLSYACDTFASPALVEGNAFEIDELEVYNVIGSRGSA